MNWEEYQKTRKFMKILALLNSKLINWFYRLAFTNEYKPTVNLSKTYLSRIPIKSYKNPDNQLGNY